MKFQPKLWPTLATLVLLSLFLYLGLWQAGKAERRMAEREQFAQRGHLAARAIGASLVDAEQLVDTPVSVQGQYEPQDQFFVDNRQEGGKAGLHLITPLRIKDSETRILVNRGWVGWPHGRQNLPQVSTPTGWVQITGVAAKPVLKNFFLMPEHAEAWPQLWSRLDLSRYTKAHTFAVQPVVVLQDQGDAQDGLLRHWPPPEDRVAMHKGYAFQWFAMAAALLAFYGYASLRRSEPD